MCFWIVGRISFSNKFIITRPCKIFICGLCPPSVFHFNGASLTLTATPSSTLQSDFQFLDQLLDLGKILLTFSLIVIDYDGLYTKYPHLILQMDPGATVLAPNAFGDEEPNVVAVIIPTLFIFLLSSMTVVPEI